MHFLPLLGKALKEDEIIDLLEDLEMTVIYDFDRLHEGQPYKYWAAAKQAGIQMRFDASQTLDVIIFHMAPEEGFAKYTQRDPDVPIFASVSEVQSFGETRQLQIAKGSSELFGLTQDWIRLGFGAYLIHYAFCGGGLARVTVMRHEP